MNTPFEQEQPLDPDLEEKLKLLRDTPPRDPQAVARGRNRFLAELGAASDVKTRPTASWKPGWPRKRNNKEEEYVMNKPQRLIFTAVLAVIALAVLFLSGAGATAYASQTSLPGDALFPVKTGLEQTQARLTLNTYERAQLQLRFAQRRLDEISRLMQARRFEDVKAASAEFEYYIGQAMQSLKTLMGSDTARAAQLSEQISAAMLAYVDALKVVWVQVPEDVRPAVLHAIQAAQDDSQEDDGDAEEIEFVGIVEAIGVDAWTIGGSVIAINPGTEIGDGIEVGDMVKVHLMTAADGSLIAREIALDDGNVAEDNDDQDEDNANDNEDENGNEDEDDANDNEDENDNGEDQNENEDENDNGDDQNDNGDDQNENGDDQNENGDDQNDNGDDQNDNGDDQNDNGDDENDNGDDQNDNGDDENDNGDEDAGDDSGGSGWDQIFAAAIASLNQL